jgi:hypothetical protein
LLDHLAKPEFPRTIATLLTEGKQVVVATKIETLAYYKEANYIDCRFAAYPYSVNNSPQIIDFVMLDLDPNNFKFSRQKLDRVLLTVPLTVFKTWILYGTFSVFWLNNGNIANL